MASRKIGGMNLGELARGAQVEGLDGRIGYVLGYEKAPHGIDIRVFHFDSDGEPAETMTLARCWEPTGESADQIVLAHMRAWQAGQDLLDVIGSYEVCQRCGGRMGAKDEMFRCLCSERER
jgi:hypothetical protein